MNIKEFYPKQFQDLSSEVISSKLFDILTEERKEKIKKVLSKRNLNLAVVLENINDRGNINAVMRSAENFGFINFNVIESEKIKDSARISQGAHKWILEKKWQTTELCIKDLKQKGFKIYTTGLNSTSKNIEDLSFDKPCAIILGNEKDGVSQKAMEMCDENFIIPTTGFTQSFNISVAASIIFYHVFRHQKHVQMDDQTLKDLEALYQIYSYPHCDKLLKSIT